MITYTILEVPFYICSIIIKAAIVWLFEGPEAVNPTP